MLRNALGMLLEQGETVCDRCTEKSRTLICSTFNTDWLCPSCKLKEEHHPEYPKAKVIENEQVKLGNFNYAGVGKPKTL